MKSNASHPPSATLHLQRCFAARQPLPRLAATPPRMSGSSPARSNHRADGIDRTFEHVVAAIESLCFMAMTLASGQTVRVASVMTAQTAPHQAFHTNARPMPPRLLQVAKAVAVAAMAWGGTMWLQMNDLYVRPHRSTRDLACIAQEQLWAAAIAGVGTFGAIVLSNAVGAVCSWCRDRELNCTLAAGSPPVWTDVACAHQAKTQPDPPFPAHALPPFAQLSARVVGVAFWLAALLSYFMLSRGLRLYRRRHVALLEAEERANSAHHVQPSGVDPKMEQAVREEQRLLSRRLDAVIDRVDAVNVRVDKLCLHLERQAASKRRSAAGGCEQQARPAAAGRCC